MREGLFEIGGRLNIHCKTTMEEPYFFTISVDYEKAPFYLPHFLQSMQNPWYESLMKEIEVQVYRKMWVNKEGLPFTARAMASKLRQVFLSIATMSALNKRVTEQMRSMDLTKQVMSQGGNQRSALPNLHGIASIPQNTLTLRSRVIVPASSKRQPIGALHAQSRKMKILGAGEMSMTSGVTKVPSDLEPDGQTDYLETKIMYKKFRTECQGCFVWNVDTKYKISIEQMV
jgi:hypothetical protein